MASHFATNVPGTNPTRWSGNAPTNQGGELTEQELKEVIQDHLVKPLQTQIKSLQLTVDAAAEAQKRLRADIAEVEADQKARGIYREPQTTVVNQHQYRGPQDTLPD
ncbi:hypothetical protein ACT3R7_12575 [Halomonas sp. AOP43-A1-21]|uniref:hypothetical protein n=1 Tax=Halomonas TaxID=2745 RepID=UPI0018680686|nr:hypothetical protein [Halomonas colorata]